MIGISATIGSIWWLFTWFVYIRKNLNEPELIMNNKNVIPLEWFWHNLPNITVGWMAASYLSTFVAYLFISFIEVWAWIAYAAGYNHMMRVWAPFAYWCVLLYIPAPLFAYMEMSLPKSQGGLNNDPMQADYLNS